MEIIKEHMERCKKKRMTSKIPPDLLAPEPVRQGWAMVANSRQVPAPGKKARRQATRKILSHPDEIKDEHTEAMIFMISGGEKASNEMTAGGHLSRSHPAFITYSKTGIWGVYEKGRGRRGSKQNAQVQKALFLSAPAALFELVHFVGARRRFPAYF